MAIKNSSGSTKSRKKLAPQTTQGIFKSRRSNLHTEIILRKEKLTPGKIQSIKEAKANLSNEDVSLLKSVFKEVDHDNTGLLVRIELHDALTSLGIHCTDSELADLLAFADADKSKAIDMDEWLMLVGLLIQPPYDLQELQNSFKDHSDSEGEISSEKFSSVLEEVLGQCLDQSEAKYIPDFLENVVKDLDPSRRGTICKDEAIGILLKPYSERGKQMYKIDEDQSEFGE